MLVALAVPVRLVGHHGTDWLAWASLILTAVTVVVLSVSAGFILNGIKDSRRTRHGQLVVDLTRRWDEPLVVESLQMLGAYENEELVALVKRLYDDEGSEPTEDDLKAYSTLAAAPNLIDMIGVLESERVITAELVYKMWGPLIADTWLGWRDAVTELQKTDYLQPANPSYAYFKRIAETMAKVETAKSGKPSQRATSGPSDSQSDAAPAA